jgi:hypothetical protein
MTAQQLHLFNGLYLVVLVVVALLTRATPRRIVGAVSGAALMYVVGLPIIPLGERFGLWRMALPWEPNFLVALWINSALCGFAFLITWRIARGFGGRGLAVVAVIAAVIGPIRDKTFVEHFPEWGSFAPGIVPVLAISATYVLAGVVGHGVMRLIAGPARGSPLARRPWEAAESGISQPQ